MGSDPRRSEWTYSDSGPSDRRQGTSSGGDLQEDEALRKYRARIVRSLIEIDNGLSGAEEGLSDLRKGFRVLFGLVLFVMLTEIALFVLIVLAYF